MIKSTMTILTDNEIKNALNTDVLKIIPHSEKETSLYPTLLSITLFNHFIKTLKFVNIKS